MTDQYIQHTRLVSDSPDMVRASDVQRLVDECPRGIDPLAFLAWLRSISTIQRTRGKIADIEFQVMHGDHDSQPASAIIR